MNIIFFLVHLQNNRLNFKLYVYAKIYNRYICICTNRLFIILRVLHNNINSKTKICEQHFCFCFY